MGTVGLELFLQAFALLCVLYCLPDVRPADQVFSPVVCHNCPADAQFSVSGSYTTPTTLPLPPVTGTTLGKIFWILVLPPLPLLALSLPC